MDNPWSLHGVWEFLVGPTGVEEATFQWSGQRLLQL